ncbi:BT_3987 domain-containing protein [Pedobacter metabolipauper]|uniref:F5/8 type C domain-containing protein n=1 Tax=Pedobacter metabolipauper TaxID=425513 RepID=A0A4R6STV1_9SPHI|nr:DUF1735 domain-containing protein [Pedobacter metabolipauper]TDQ07494.1 F5/8 type C domain-containing protein [Pedobacter metabolipauper]
MRKINIITICSLIVLLMGCSKENDLVSLPDGSVSFAQAAGSDTIEMPVSILLDNTLVLEIKAALSGSASSDKHHVTFAVDTTKILEYRAKYGAALLPPSTSYLFFKPTVVIPAGASVSEAAQLNIGQQTKLTEYSTYVLPVVIKSVDGKIEGAATSRVIYYVFKTGKPLFVNKTGWAIVGQSSVNGTQVAANLLDANNLTTYWGTTITATMPQWVTINFNREVSFIAVNYYLPTLLKYPTLGGYPKTIQIETSMNGTTWVNKGVFPGNIAADGSQSIDVGATTARYLRFTVLSSEKYISGASLYEAIFISGISLVP